MKAKRTFLALLLIFSLLLTLPVMVYADGTDEDEDAGRPVKELKVKPLDDAEDEEEDSDEDESSEDEDAPEVEKPEHDKKAWEGRKVEYEAEREFAFTTMASLRIELEEAEAALEAAEQAYEDADSDDARAEAQEAIDEAKADIAEIKAEIEALRMDLKALREQIREAIREQYTEQEREKLDEVGETLREKHGVTPLTVDSVIIHGTNPKFDTPAVIKNGRVLLPLRAIAEGFKASVDWNDEDPDDRFVTVTSANVDVVITLYVDQPRDEDGKVSKDEEENIYDVKVERDTDGDGDIDETEWIDLDVNAELMNGRSMVPLRFIAETLGLKVEWDGESRTVEIEDEDEDE